MDRKTHWDNVYLNKGPFNVSWYTPHLETSLALIQRCKVGPDVAVIDIGGGASSLVDDLLADGFQRITVLDISQTALDHARQRLGDRAQRVRWLRDDITTTQLCPPLYDIWHDRAVFHFLTDPEDRRHYLETLQR